MASGSYDKTVKLSDVGGVGVDDRRVSAPVKRAGIKVLIQPRFVITYSNIILSSQSIFQAGAAAGAHLQHWAVQPCVPARACC